MCFLHLYAKQARGMSVFRIRRVMLWRLSGMSLVCLLFYSVLSQSVFQNPALLTEAHGLSDSHLNCILEDYDGFIWIGSKNGLNRYDGRSFLQFHNGYGEGTLPGLNIKCLAVYDSMHILAGTDMGVARIHSGNFQIESVVFPASRELAARTNNVHQFALLDNGMFWVVTTGGVFLVSAELSVMQSYDFPAEYVHTAAHLQPSRLWRFPDGRLWVVGPVPTQFDPQLIYAIHPDQGTMRRLESQPFPDAVRFLSLVQANDTLGFVLYEHSGGVSTVLYDLRRDIRKDVPCKPFRFEFFMPFLSRPETGKIGLSTRGLTEYFSFDIARKSWNYYPLPQSYILQGVVQTADGIVLAATSKGLLKTSPVSRLFTYDTQVEFMARQSGETGFRMTGMSCNEGVCIVSSWNGRLVVFDEKTYAIPDAFDVIHPQGGMVNIFTVQPFGPGEFLIGTNRGCFLFRTSDGTTRLLAGKNKPSFFDTLTAFPFTDSRGDIWFGFVQFMGLVKFDRSKGVFTHYPFTGEYGHLYFNEISCMTEDGHGNLWFGWANGGLGQWNRSSDTIMIVDPDNVQAGTFKNNITTMATGPDGKIWIGTAGYGIFSFHPDSMVFHSYPDRQGRSRDHIVSLDVDCTGNVWAGTRKGLLRLDVTTRQFYNFTQQHGLPSDHIYAVRALAGDDTCSMFIGAESGYRMINARHFPVLHPAGEVVVHQFRVNQELRHFTPGQHFRLQYNENTIEIEFSSLNLLDGYLDEYAYRLSDKDMVWKPLGPENILRLAGLQDGVYHVTLRICSNGGVCAEQSLVQFTIRKMFWKSPLFYGLMVLLAASITAVYFGVKINNINRLHFLRKKIAYDLHDEIGSNLGSIQILTALSKNPNVSIEKKSEIADKIKEAAGQVNQSLEEIIWSLNPGNDRFESVRHRIYAHTSELLEARDIVLHFNMEPGLEAFTLPHDKRRELLLLYREALHNVLKYAQCKHVWIDITRSGNRFVLTIRDDGIGFDPEAVSDGNGLNTMRFRAANLDGHLAISSQKGVGTEIRLTF